MATIKDVARLAGVSVATVSCHLSGAKPVKPETKMKIEQAIRELKYVPNAAARQLKKANIKSVGVILPDFNEHLYTEIFRGIVKFFQSRRIFVNVAFSHSNAGLERQEFFNFAHQNVMGLIVISCQPQSQDFFEEWQRSYHIPIIFCMHEVRGAGAGFIGFDNFSSARHISAALLAGGLNKQIILSRDDRFSTEADFLHGVQSAYASVGRCFELPQRVITNGTKENAFKATIEVTNRPELPDAILCTSGEISKGVLEALSALKLSIPNDILVVTLGEESWNKSEHLAGVIYTTRNAANLGMSAAKMLLDHVDAPTATSLQSLLLPDRFLSRSISLPQRRRQSAPAIAPRASLRLLAFFGAHEGCQIAIENVLRIYEAETGVHVSTASETYSRIHDPHFLNWLAHDSDCDFMLMDLPWKETLIKIGAVSKLDDMIERSDFPRDRLLSCDFSSFFYKGSCYGIPIINGAQTLFYRRDLFENSAVKDAYYKKYNSVLRPPRTWHEYNRVAAFFTRSFNPASPTMWGTSEMDSDIGSLIAPNFSRFTAAGGCLANEKGELTLDTPANRVAFEITLEPFKFQKDNGIRKSDITPIGSFCLGETAMCITFNDSATKILDALNNNQIGQLGYAVPPEGHSIRAGWAAGINPRSAQREEIYRFFKWFMRTDISYYYTILSGNTICKPPYLNGEILNLYPWMELFPGGECNYSKRIAWCRSSGGAEISNVSLEQAFCDILIRLVKTDAPIETVLAEAQRRLTENR